MTPREQAQVFRRQDLKTYIRLDLASMRNDGIDAVNQALAIATDNVELTDKELYALKTDIKNIRTQLNLIEAALKKQSQ